MPDNANIQRPPHFRETPEERTEINPTVDYPSAPEMEPYQDIREPEEPLRVAVETAPEPKRETLYWSSNRFPIGTTPVRIAGNNPQRRRLVVQNDDKSTAVYLGATELSAVFTMFELHSDSGNERARVEFHHQGEVWAVCDTGDSTTLSVFSELAPRE